VTPDFTAVLETALAAVAAFDQAVKTLGDAIPPTPDRSGEHLSPFEIANKRRHGAFLRGLKLLGYRPLNKDGFLVHPRGARLHWRQVDAAWRARSTSEILAVMAYVRSRPALASELWSVR
jgi:hypothetical protein